MVKSLERLRKNQEEIAQRTVADARRARDEVVERHNALEASLSQLTGGGLIDIALAASLDDARARVIKQLAALAPVIERREAELEAALGQLRIAARDRQATERLVARRAEEAAQKRARAERKEEDEIGNRRR